MINTQNCKAVILKTVISSSAADTSDYIDHAGYHYATFIVGGAVATATNSSQTLTTLTLTEGDTTSSFSSITGFVGGTAFTIPVNNDTAARLSYRMDVDLRNRKRYLQMSIRAAAAGSTDTSVACILSRAEQSPNTTTEAGVLGWTIG